MPDDHFPIRAHKISPLRRNRPNRAVVHLQQEALAVTVVSLADARELLSAQRVERMRDPHKLQRCS